MMSVSILYVFILALSTVNAFLGLHRGVVQRQGSVQSNFQLFAKKMKMKVTNDQNGEAYDAWFSLNGRMKETAPNYLTKEKAKVKFANVVTAVGSVEDALRIVKTDPTVLNYREATVSEAFAAWSVALDSNEKTVELCVRNPPVLSFRADAIENINPGDLAQTQFWSYFAVATRPLTVGLQKLIRVH